MNEGAHSLGTRLVVLAIAIFLPLEILAIVAWLFIGPGFYPTPVIVAAIPLGALSLGLAYERRVAWWLAAPIFMIQGAANGLMLLGTVGGLLASRGGVSAASIGTVALSLAANALAAVLVILFFSRGVRRRFFRNDRVAHI